MAPYQYPHGCAPTGSTGWGQGPAQPPRPASLQGSAKGGAKSVLSPTTRRQSRCFESGLVPEAPCLSPAPAASNLILENAPSAPSVAHTQSPDPPRWPVPALQPAPLAQHPDYGVRPPRPRPPSSGTNAPLRKPLSPCPLTHGPASPRPGCHGNGSPWALSRPGLEKPTFTCQLLQSPKGPGSPCWAPGCSLHTRKRNPTGHCPLPTAPPTLSSPGRIFSQQRDPAATRLRRGAPGRRQACTGRGRRAWLRAGAPQRLQGAPCGHIQPAHWALQPPARPWVNSTD